MLPPMWAKSTKPLANCNHYTSMLVELLPANVPLPPGHARSEGIHLSRIIRSIAVESGILNPAWVEDLSLIEVQGGQEEWWNKLDMASQLRMSIGLAWEQWYIPLLGNVVWQPGEMQVDGIYMTHDGESIDAILTPKGEEYHLCLHEVKATYKSTKTVGDLSTQWMWTAQTKGYCKGLNTLVAYVHVLFICGDYKYPITPQLRVYRVTFTQAEIDDNWDLMKSQIQHSRQQEAEDTMRDTL